MNYENNKHEKSNENHENESPNANYFFSKLVIHFEELNMKFIELYKIDSINRFYEIKKLNDENKSKLSNILSEIPKNLEKEMRNKLRIFYEKYKIKEKTNLKTEARIYSKYINELKLNKNKLGIDSINDETSIIKSQIKDHLKEFNQKTKNDIENLKKEKDNLMRENKYTLI